MSNDNEEAIIDGIDHLSKLGGLLKLVVGGAVLIGSSILAVGFWVWTINGVTAAQGTALEKMQPKVERLESWRTGIEARPVVSPAEVYTLDKRMQRVEDQNAVMLEMLREIKGRL
jgi:hypothetical protein